MSVGIREPEVKQTDAAYLELRPELRARRRDGSGPESVFLPSWMVNEAFPYGHFGPPHFMMIAVWSPRTSLMWRSTKWSTRLYRSEM